jgi:diacylglycerol kinase family enzyme
MEPTPLAASAGDYRPGTDGAAASSTFGEGDPSRRASVGVIRNPRSHRNRNAAAGTSPDPQALIAAPADREELGQALARFAEQKIGLLVVDGGDGTMREVLTRGAAVFGERWPELVVLPKGKTNALAIDLGMPGKWSLEEALESRARARTVVRRPIAIERLDADGRPVQGFIMGTGMFNAAIATGQVAHRFGAFQGFAVAITALTAVLQALFGIGESRWRSLSLMRFHAGEDDHTVPHSRHGAPDQRYAAGLSSLHKFPLGMQPFAGTGEGIRYLVVDAPLRRVIALVPAILMGLKRPFLRDLGVHRGSADRLTIELGDRFILDGEAFPPGRYRLRLGPPLRFLVP